MIARLRRLLSRKRRTVKFISWYVAPGDGKRYWLASYDYGVPAFYYSGIKLFAHKFDTFDEAEARTPHYDGSAAIEKRTGVEIVTV